MVYHSLVHTSNLCVMHMPRTGLYMLQITTFGYTFIYSFWYIDEDILSQYIANGSL